MRQTTWTKVCGVLLACVMVGTFAADGDTPPTTPPATPPAAGGGGQGGGRQRGQGGQPFDPAAFAQQRMDRLKTALGVNDDEWKALQPKVEAVTVAQRASFAGRGGGGGFGRRGQGGQGGQGGQAQDPATMTDLQKKQDALRKLLDDPNTDAKAIQEALKAYRDERAKGADALKKAQSDLKELLTAKQEAIMVLQGMID